MTGRGWPGTRPSATCSRCTPRGNGPTQLGASGSDSGRCFGSSRNASSSVRDRSTPTSGGSCVSPATSRPSPPARGTVLRAPRWCSSGGGQREASAGRFAAPWQPRPVTAGAWEHPRRFWTSAWTARGSPKPCPTGRPGSDSRRRESVAWWASPMNHRWTSFPTDCGCGGSPRWTSFAAPVRRPGGVRRRLVPAFGSSSTAIAWVCSCRGATWPRIRRSSGRCVRLSGRWSDWSAEPQRRQSARGSRRRCGARCDTGSRSPSSSLR
jgi:hypothetical protein